MTDAKLDQAANLIDRFINISPPPDSDTPPVDLQQKLDRLSEIIDMIRYRKGYVGTDETPEIIHPNSLSIRGDQSGFELGYDRALPTLSLKSHRRPPDLALPLLLFLKGAAPAREDILGTLRDFIQKHRDLFSMIDFQRTRTGVVRCETNVRLAAGILRESGLLRVDSSSSFKHWQLSVLGIVVNEAELATDLPRGPTLLCWRRAVMNQWIHLLHEGRLESRIDEVSALAGLKPGTAGLLRGSAAMMEKIKHSIRDFLAILEHGKRESSARLLQASILLQQIEGQPEVRSLMDAFNAKRFPK